MKVFATASCTGVALVAQLAAAYAEPVTDCNQSRNLELRVRGCTEILGDAGFSADQKAVAFRNRASARAEAGAIDQAMADFNDAIRLNPGDAAAHAGRAQVRLARGDTDAAIADFTAALQVTPNSVAALAGRGHSHLLKGDAALAIADLTEAIRLNPSSSSAFNNRGLAHRKKGDIDAAIADYTTAVVLNPIYALAYNNRGYAYEAKGMKTEAIADFGRALQLDPSLVGASDGLKRLQATGAQLGAQPTESDRLVREGQALVEANCARCHAVSTTGQSPNPKAPEFRTLQQRHPVQALREPVSRGIAAPHDEMPKFALASGDIDKIIAYISSLSNAPKK